jgi:hypothetical protein
MFKPRVVLVTIKMGDVEDVEQKSRMAILSWQSSQQARDLAVLNIHYNGHSVERIYDTTDYFLPAHFIKLWANEYNDEDLFIARINGLLNHHIPTRLIKL